MVDHCTHVGVLRVQPVGYLMPPVVPRHKPSQSIHSRSGYAFTK